MMKLRKAAAEEAPRCYQFINDARAYHRELGFVQWHPDYPTQDTITEDIKAGVGYVFADEADCPLGYCCLILGEEPAYRNIEGAWKLDGPYAVVHRMAFGAGSRGRGASREAFALLKERCRAGGVFSIRVDTQAENKVMQHILDREGFGYRGLIQFDGGPKLAYELNF